MASGTRASSRKKPKKGELSPIVCRFDPEGGWPLDVDESALPVGVSAENWDHKNGPRPCILSFLLRDLVSVDTINQTFKPRIQFTIDWVDDGILEKEKEDEYVDTDLTVSVTRKCC